MKDEAEFLRLLEQRGELLDTLTQYMDEVWEVTDPYIGSIDYFVRQDVRRILIPLRNALKRRQEAE